MWLAFAAGVACTLGTEFLLAHFFLWKSKRGVVAATAIVAGDKPWIKSAESIIASKEGSMQDWGAIRLKTTEGEILTHVKALEGHAIDGIKGAFATPVPDLTVSSTPTPKP